MEIDFIKNDKNVTLEDAHKIVEHLYKDYLLIKRLIYKLSNQFRSHKQFKLLIQLRKNIENLLSLKHINYSKNNEAVLENSHILLIFLEDKINFTKDLTVRLGCMIKEMMHLKLHIPYCIIVLGITSRLNFLLNFLEENRQKFIDLMKSQESKQMSNHPDSFKAESINYKDETLLKSLNDDKIGIQNSQTKNHNKRNERYFDLSKELNSGIEEEIKNKDIEDILKMSIPQQKMMLNTVIENTNGSFLSKKRINIKNI